MSDGGMETLTTQIANWSGVKYYHFVTLFLGYTRPPTHLVRITSSEDVVVLSNFAHKLFVA